MIPDGLDASIDGENWQVEFPLRHDQTMFDFFWPVALLVLCLGLVGVLKLLPSALFAAFFGGLWVWQVVRRRGLGDRVRLSRQPGHIAVENLLDGEVVRLVRVDEGGLSCGVSWGELRLQNAAQWEQVLVTAPLEHLQWVHAQVHRDR